jgi:hypothetical protein
MKLMVHTIVAKQNDLKAMADFLRQIPDGQQFRFDLAPGQEYRNEGYARGSMTGYYLHADGEVACCLLINNLFAHQHQAITEYYDSRYACKTTLGIKAGIEQALGFKLNPDPSGQDIDEAIKRIEKYIGECGTS